MLADVCKFLIQKTYYLGGIVKMGGTCSVPVKQIYGVHTGTSDVMEKIPGLAIVNGKEVETEETVRRLTFTFRGDDGRTYMMRSTLELNEPDTVTPRLRGKLKMYLPVTPTDSGTDRWINDVNPASNADLPPTIWRDPNGRLMNGKGRPVCDEYTQPSFFAQHFRAINIVACLIAFGVVVMVGVTQGPVAGASVSSVCAVLASLVYLALFVSYFRSF